MAPIVVYRGQKEWYQGMNITASSLRRSSAAPDPAAWTEPVARHYRQSTRQRIRR